MDKEAVQIVIAQMADVQGQHPGLELTIAPSGELLVRGTVGFHIEHEGRVIKDFYQVELAIPPDYPGSPPAVWETGNAIPEDFGHFLSSGALCLGAPVEVRRVFARNRTLIGFINDQLVPFLFSHSFKRDHGKMPFGELGHGPIGLLQYYVAFFRTSGINALKLLRRLADGTSPPLSPCPCGGGKKLKDCHGPKLGELRQYLPPGHFEFELRELAICAEKRGIHLSEREVTTERSWKRKQRRLRKEARVKKRRSPKGVSQ